MARSLAVFVVVVAIAAVALTPARTRPATPAPEVEPAQEAASVSEARQVARCPWVRGDGFIDGTLALASPEATNATITVPVSGSVAGSATVPVSQFGSVRFLDVAAIGTGSAFVEFDAAPAAAAAVGEGRTAVAAAECRSGASKSWVLAGGSTLTDETLQLRLFNPFPQDARITIRVVSENDSEPESSLETVSVAAQSTATFDLGQLLALRETLGLSITDPEGLIVPAFVQAVEAEDDEGDGFDADLAAWTGTAPAPTWFFPYAYEDGVETSLVLFNDQPVSTSWRVSTVGADGTEVVADGTLEPLTLTKVALAEVAAGPAGVIVDAEEPVGAFLVAKGPTQRAATAGAPRPAESWLVPGIDALAGPARVWIMNPTSTPLTATYRLASAGGLGPAQKISVPANSVRSFSTRADLVVVADGGIVVGWVRSAPGMTAFGMGVPESGSGR